MASPSHKAQQIAVHMKLGFIPVLMVRQSVPNQYFGWEWTSWRRARIGEVIHINSLLMKLWTD